MRIHGLFALPRHAALVCAIAASMFMAPLAHAAEGGADGWDWMVAPYVWGMSFDSDLQRTEPPDGGINSDISFDDVLSDFDGVFQAHIEGRTDHWGVFADFTYLGLAEEREYPRFRTESDLDARLFEVAAVWSPGDERGKGLDVFAGLRYIDLDMSVIFEPTNPEFESTVFDGSQSFNDFMLGARYTLALSDRWALTLRGDGSFGDTEGTWNASAVANYQMQRGAWLLGYRYLSVEVETDDSNIDMTMHGPVIGYGFQF